MDEHQKQLIAEKKAELETKSASANLTGKEGAAGNEGGEESWAANATLCAKCNNKAVVLLDGCQTCMNCGDSKCG